MRRRCRCRRVRPGSRGSRTGAAGCRRCCGCHRRDRCQGAPRVRRAPRVPQVPHGATGATGAQGATGAEGATGAQGATGAAGADGAQGPAGPAGPQGPQGPIGPKGDTGDTGATGATGAQGRGAAGADGATGAAGATGPAGPVGPQGPQGAVGPQGADGCHGCDRCRRVRPVRNGTQGPGRSDWCQGPQVRRRDRCPGPAGATGATGPDYLMRMSRCRHRPEPEWWRRSRTSTVRVPTAMSLKALQGLRRRSDVQEVGRCVRPRHGGATRSPSCLFRRVNSLQRALLRRHDRPTAGRPCHADLDARRWQRAPNDAGGPTTGLGGLTGRCGERTTRTRGLRGPRVASGARRREPAGPPRGCGSAASGRAARPW